MKGRFFAATVFSALVLTACSVNGSKENAVDKSEVNKGNEEVTLKPENINLGIVLGEDTVAGRIEVYEFDNFRLHVYYTQDVMNDASYIVEGTDSVVSMEHPLFRVNVREFDTYLEKLAKPVAKRIADYHIGGTGDKVYYTHWTPAKAHMDFLEKNREVAFSTIRDARPSIHIFQVMKISGTTLYFAASPQKEVYTQLEVV